MESLKRSKMLRETFVFTDEYVEDQVRHRELFKAYESTKRLKSITTLVWWFFILSLGSLFGGGIGDILGILPGFIPLIGLIATGLACISVLILAFTAEKILDRFSLEKHKWGEYYNIILPPIALHDLKPWEAMYKNWKKQQTETKKDTFGIRFINHVKNLNLLSVLFLTFFATATFFLFLFGFLFNLSGFLITGALLAVVALPLEYLLFPLQKKMFPYDDFGLSDEPLKEQEEKVSADYETVTSSQVHSQKEFDDGYSLLESNLKDKVEVTLANLWEAITELKTVNGFIEEEHLLTRTLEEHLPTSVVLYGKLSEQRRESASKETQAFLEDLDAINIQVDSVMKRIDSLRTNEFYTHHSFLQEVISTETNG